MFKFIEKKIELVFSNPSILELKGEYSKDEKDFILKKNIIMNFSVIVFFFAAIYNIVIFSSIDLGVYLSLLLILIIDFFINSKKTLYFLRFLILFFINIGILLVCIIFERSEFYVFIFFIIIYVSNILFSYKKVIYSFFLSIESIVFVFIVHYFNRSLAVASEKHLLSNIIFMLIVFTGISSIAAKINYIKDAEFLKDKAKLFKINKSLKKTNYEIDQLNVAALHSMKTPLYVAEDFIKQLHENTIQGKENFDNKEYITLIKNSIQLSEMYVQHLFIYDSIITNTITYEYFNVLEKIKFVTEIVTKKSNNVSIIIDCKDFMVHTNEFCFLVILENLITNGLKYNTNKQKTIIVTARKSKYETVLTIKDNGVGIEPIYFDRIFYPFVRINQNVMVEGSGLGLSSVKIAASKINGNVKIVESSNKGTTFEFNFKNNLT